MEKINVGLVILAAGKGTRLKMKMPKAIAPIAGKSLIDFPISALQGFVGANLLQFVWGIVVGHQKEMVIEHLKISQKNINIATAIAWQKEQLGTAHALQTYFNEIDGARDTDYTVVMCADTPLISTTELSTLYNEFRTDDQLKAVAATFKAINPTGYGRIKKSQNGFRIIEEADASPEQKQIDEVNSGLYIIRTDYVLNFLRNVDNKNKSGEFYLTDLFNETEYVKAVCFQNESIFQGVNNLDQLEQVSLIKNKEKISQLKDLGVRFIDSTSVFIEWDVEIQEGTVIEPNVYIKGNTKIGKDCLIEIGSVVKNSIIENNVNILGYSYLEDAIVHSNASIGPYARLRPGADIGIHSKIGNFVEIKKSVLHEGVKVSHLSYIGDAEIGKETNIGCGFITCNYDGANKNKTIIGENAFIGSDCQTIAPVTIGNGAYVGSGSTINKNIPDDAFAIARARQETKPDMAKRFVKKKK